MAQRNITVISAVGLNETNLILIVSCLCPKALQVELHLFSVSELQWLWHDIQVLIHDLTQLTVSGAKYCRCLRPWFYLVRLGKRRLRSGVQSLLGLPFGLQGSIVCISFEVLPQPSCWNRILQVVCFLACRLLPIVVGFSGTPWTIT
jgi:hypothetical protein